MSETKTITFKSIMKIGGLVLATSLLGMVLLFYTKSVVEYPQESDVEKLCGLLDRSSINLELRLVEDKETNELLVIDCDEYSN